MKDMSKKSQNIDTSEKCVHESDISIHEPWDTSDMAHRPNGLTIDDDLPDKPTVKQFVWFIEAKLKEKNT